MRVVSQFIVRVCELIEAEGAAFLSIARQEAGRARSVAVQLAVGLALLAVAIPVLITGLGLMTLGLYWLLEARLEQWLAACLTGASVLGVGLFITLASAHLSRRPHP